jgi:hypothetical protein
VSELHGIGSLSPDVFAASFMSLGRRIGVLVAPVFDPRRFVVIDGADVYPLDTAYGEYLACAPAARSQLLLRLLAELRGPLHAHVGACDPDALMPRLRSSAELDRLTLEQDAAHAPCAWHLAADVHLGVVVDSDEVMTTVSGEMLRTWGMAAEDLRRRAEQNLRRASTAALSELVPGLWIGPWEDGYAASRLLFAEQLAPCSGAVFAAPSRDTLFALAPDDEGAVATLMTLLERITESEHPISAELFTVQAQPGEAAELVRWRPADEALALRHHNLLRTLQVERYAQQLARLQGVVGSELHVARAELDETRAGALVSRALWTEGVPALLPEVDRLHLLSTAEDGTSSRILSARFADVVALPGVLERTAHVLARWRPRRFPSDEELDAIAVSVARDEATLSLR